MKVPFDQCARIRLQPILPRPVVAFEIGIGETPSEPKGRQALCLPMKDLIPSKRRKVKKSCASSQGFGDASHKRWGGRAQQHESAVTGTRPVDSAAKDPEKVRKMLCFIKDD